MHARDLALKCGVSERTIHRDIAAISAAHMPVYYENGYKLLDEKFLPPLCLTPQELQFIDDLLRRRPKNAPLGDHVIVQSIRGKLEASLVEFSKAPNYNGILNKRAEEPKNLGIMAGL